MKKIYLLGICALIVSCSGNKKENTESKDLIDTNISLAIEENIETSEKLKLPHTKVIIKDIKGYGICDSFAFKAADQIEKAINSDEFEQEILKGNFKKTEGLSNNEILKAIRSGIEKQGPGGEVNTWDLRLRIITLEEDGEKWIKNCKPGSWAGTIGIDGKGDGVAAICKERLDFWCKNDSLHELAGHFAHEYMHLLGFSHNGIFKSRSLVYQVGDIISDLVDKNYRKTSSINNN
jgi:hypothetical protein